jgi:hypothetical protein
MSASEYEQQPALGIPKSTGISLGALIGFSTIAFVIVLVVLSKEKHVLL